MNIVQLRNTLILLLTAAIWGTGFVAQSVGAEYVGPCTFLATRSWLAGFVLLPLFGMPSIKQELKKKSEKKQLLVGGLFCGIFLFAGSITQQIGMATTTPAKAGFITALYVLFVPVISIFSGRRVNIRIWICVIAALVGLYLLCIKESLSIAVGDIWVLLCALLFAGHILAVNRFAPKLNGLALSCIQFLVTAAISTVCMMLFENPDWNAMRSASYSILYAGLISSCVGFTLQIIGQKDLNPTIASLAMSLESVFSAVAGWLILNQSLSGREITGCFLMFISIVIAQLPERHKIR